MTKFKYILKSHTDYPNNSCVPQKELSQDFLRNIRLP